MREQCDEASILSVVFVTLRDWYVPWAQEPTVSPSLKALCWLVLYLFIAVQQMSSEFMFVSQVAPLLVADSQAIADGLFRSGLRSDIGRNIHDFLQHDS